MTALTKYQRLEASALWRADDQTQRREVVVSLGDATLVISGTDDAALTHWSLAAVERANPGTLPAIFHPDGDPGETLEISPDETEMIEAIEKLRQAIERRRPHPGRLRAVMLAASIGAVAALGYFWLPGAMRDYAMKVVPQVRNEAISDSLLTRLERLSGTPCQGNGAMPALRRLAERTRGNDLTPRLVVLRGGLDGALMLPGNVLLLSRNLLEDHDEPDVVAGFILAERERARLNPPLRHLLDNLPLSATFRLITTGEIPAETLAPYAETVLTAPRSAAPDEVLLEAFDEAQLRATPYAYGRDITGESTLALIEADPHAAAPPPPVLSDGDWLRLQGICGN